MSSFFKKLRDEVKDLLADDDKDKQKQEGPGQGVNQQTRDYAPNVYPPQPYPPYGNNAPPPQPTGYGQPPAGPQLPPGWISQWDPNSQRYYYLEQATGRTQWEPPAWGGPPGAPGYYQTYGNAMPGVPYTSGHDQNSRQYYAASPPADSKGSGMGTVLAAGVGGAALGALAAHALDDDGPGAATNTAAPAGGGYAAPPPAPVVPLEDNPELSRSQRESLEEAREDLEEARQEVADDSSPSSSDIEDLREAEEEYASEVESAQEELED